VRPVQTLSAPPPPPAEALPRPAINVEPVRTDGLTPEDLTLARSLERLVSGGGRVGAAEIASAQRLYDRQPEAKSLFEVVLLGGALTAEAEHRGSDALGLLLQILRLDPDNLQARQVLVRHYVIDKEWVSAEATAREGLQKNPGDALLLKGLGMALFWLDRSKEAAEALRASLETREDAEVRSLLGQIAKGMTDERGMTEKDVAHFDLRYDGEAHDAVGHEILRMLEHHYATLIGIMDFQPPMKVPVVLFSNETYHEASGAPGWSAADFDLSDGRIRCNIGGLSQVSAGRLDQVLLHELTHAFVFYRSRGLAPSEFQEGFAQYMEGQRVASLLTPAQMTDLADGRLGGVGGYYMNALSFVEHLMALRGQGGVNDLLKAMGETGSVDTAFQQVYGSDYSGTRKVWLSHFRQQYGS
jgi:tetratricopeptide (TPR) repeat protein